MTDPTEAIRDAREQITSALAHLGFSDDSVRAPLHKAARNLSYALKAMSALEVKADPLREALIQIKTVCEDNSPNSCDQRMALNFVWQIAAANLAASGLPAPQPPAPITTEQHREEIARIIHPVGFEEDSMERISVVKAYRKEALAKADRILALPPPVTTDRAAVIEEIDARFFIYRFEYADGSAFEVFADGRAFIVFKDGRREEKTGKITNRIPAAIRAARALVDAKEEGKT